MTTGKQNKWKKKKKMGAKTTYLHLRKMPRRLKLTFTSHGTQHTLARSRARCDVRMSPSAVFVLLLPLTKVLKQKINFESKDAVKRPCRRQKLIRWCGESRQVLTRSFYFFFLQIPNEWLTDWLTDWLSDMCSSSNTHRWIIIIIIKMSKKKKNKEKEESLPCE